MQRFFFNFRAFSIDAEFFFCQFPTSFTVCLAYITEQLFFAMINVEILPTHRIIEHDMMILTFRIGFFLKAWIIMGVFHLLYRSSNVPNRGKLKNLAYGPTYTG